MVGMDHKPASAEVHDPATSARNARIGLMLFAVYLSLYGGFVGVNAFAPQRMEQIVWGGLNVAVLYGFALILSAFVLSLVYGWLVRNPVGGGSRDGKGAGQ
ncbi:MAG: DUF485 domain-containing protein [Pirellulaceae bacterium]